jgi:hypothetical protein
MNNIAQEQPIDNPIPFSIEAEYSLIGLLLWHPQVFPAVKTLLNPRDFRNLEHQNIFKSILAVASRGEAIDPVTVSADLKHCGIPDINDLSAFSYLSNLQHNEMELFNTESPEKRAVTYARLIAQLAERRRLIYKTGDIIAIAQNGSKEPTKESIALLQELLPTKGNQSNDVGTLMSDVKPEKVRWLWPGKLALGKVHMFDGDPGIGKTLLMLSIGANLTLDLPMPGEEKSYASGGMVLVCLEDGIADTIQPRLARADADLSKVISIGYLKEKTAEGKEYERPFTINDLDILESAIKRVDAKLVVIDPVMAILCGRDTYKDNEVRVALAPLKELAERYNVAIVLIRHVVKGGGEKAIYMGGGSIGFIGLARIGLMAICNPDNQEQYIFANIKNNLVKKSPKLLYSIASEDGVDERPYIKWEGISSLTDQELIKPASKNTGDNRHEIKRILEECKPVAMSVAEIAEAMPEMSMSNLKKTLTRMYDGREIGKSARGAYHAL